MQRIPSGRACWPVGSYRFDYEEVQRCFSSLSYKGGLVRHQDNETSKWHVKLTRLCAIIQAFDLTNVFVPSSVFCKYLHFSACPLLLPLFLRVPETVKQELKAYIKIYLTQRKQKG